VKPTKVFMSMDKAYDWIESFRNWQFVIPNSWFVIRDLWFLILYFSRRIQFDA
jgi:hypothetical protein